jgi:hypothetical protein
MIIPQTSQLILYTIWRIKILPQNLKRKKNSSFLIGNILISVMFFFGSHASWLGSHPEASGHGSPMRRASRGIRGFSSLGKIHGLTNQLA